MFGNKGKENMKDNNRRAHVGIIWGYIGIFECHLIMQHGAYGGTTWLVCRD